VSLSINLHPILRDVLAVAGDRPARGVGVMNAWVLLIEIPR
jgi:hypothetical protein